MIDFSFAVWDWGLSMSAVISCCHRKWKNKSKFSKLIIQIKTYSPLLGLFSIV
jgi:hypothetical protein